MSDTLQTTPMADHIAKVLSLLEQGAHMVLSGIPDDPTLACYSFPGDVAKALHAQLADAKAAQAMVVERAAKELDERGQQEQVNFGLDRCTQNFYRARDIVRALADTDGMAMVQALRAELGRLREIVRVNGLRSGATDAEIDAVLYPKSQEAAK